MHHGFHDQGAIARCGNAQQIVRTDRNLFGYPDSALILMSDLASFNDLQQQVEADVPFLHTLPGVEGCHHLAIETRAERHGDGGKLEANI